MGNEEIKNRMKKLSCLKFVMFAGFALSFFFCVEFLQAQEAEQPREQTPVSPFLTPPPGKGEFWLCPSGEFALYSKRTFSYGAGITIAYGKKASIGFKGAFFLDEQQELDVLELHFLLRLYIQGGPANSGLFLQAAGGPAIFLPRKDGISLPADFGLLSASFSLGWRFLLGDTFFAEPIIRGGYPFVVGASLSAGVRF